MPKAKERGIPLTLGEALARELLPAKSRLVSQVSLGGIAWDLMTLQDREGYIRAELAEGLVQAILTGTMATKTSFIEGEGLHVTRVEVIALSMDEAAQVVSEAYHRGLRDGGVPRAWR